MQNWDSSTESISRLLKFSLIKLEVALISSRTKCSNPHYLLKNDRMISSWYSFFNLTLRQIKFSFYKSLITQGSFRITKYSMHFYWKPVGNLLSLLDYFWKLGPERSLLFAVHWRIRCWRCGRGILSISKFILPLL